MKWKSDIRPEPEPCREQDEGKFEISYRDGQARLGKLHTKHGILQTPCLLPVINPNIRTIEPNEMWNKYGIQALITNSYVIWKHDELKEKALADGVHSLLDYPGVIMTDSGTFQSYVYGDVEVGVEDIVKFQNDIGVDIATMLDVFTRPDMTFAEVEEAVDETLNRAEKSLTAANGTMLNGPIQGGIFPELRVKSAKGMSEHAFSVHPIGGIVPIMENHNYRDLVKIMLASKSNLTPNRPVHMFGCGHPMLFPMLVAMGADLFDSAAYALFARDGRLLTPWGTERITEMEEWPILMPAVVGVTPAEVRSMSKDERTEILAKFNLEVTLQEMSRCRQAIRDGKIWQLAEMRSHQHPSLRQAFLWLITNPARSSMEPLILDDVTASKETGSEKGAWEENWDWLVYSQTSPRIGSESWGGFDTYHRPQIELARRRLFSRWKSNKTGDVILFHGASAPWRERIGYLTDKLVNTDYELFVYTPVGLLPWGLEDLNPWAHIEGPDWLWKRRPDLSWAQRELERLGITDRKIITFDISDTENLHEKMFKKLSLDEPKRDQNKRLTEQMVQKLVVLLNVENSTAQDICDDATFTMSRTERIRNMTDKEGRHLFSPRLAEGGISLTIDGATLLHSLRKEKIPIGFPDEEFGFCPGKGPAWIVVNDDAVPYIKQGRNVMHGFVEGVDKWLRPNENVLIVDTNGNLVGFGRSNSTVSEMASSTKGIAVKTREGIR
ncbi:MAG: tRNA guanosine(15) transglycosylase TgtA [Methanobacteriota archaeon]|nr:MAG: tRNA guanosine(15) transglycosylase TgtA [Euryarchaeota archaeon]